MALGWPWRRERRTDTGYTALEAARAVLTVHEGNNPISTAGATAARIWAAALAGCECSHQSLTPGIRRTMGEDLITRGRILYARTGGAWRRAADGERERKGWRLDVTKWDGSRDILQVPHENVLFIPWSTSPDDPWRGVGPLDTDAARAVAALERVLRNEASSPHAYVLPVPSPDALQNAQDHVREMVEAVRNAKGGLLSVTSMGALGDPARWKPTEWQARRIGGAPPAEVLTARNDLADATLAACGVPSDLMASGRDAESSREAWRQFTFSSLRPFLRELETRASRILGRRVTLDSSPLEAADVQGRARAYKSFTDAGMSPEHAAAAVGVAL